jgi:hypothetical protein
MLIKILQFDIYILENLISCFEKQGHYTQRVPPKNNYGRWYCDKFSRILWSMVASC